MDITAKPHGVRYPWQCWFSSRKTVLVYGRDFRCRPDAFVSMAYQRVRRYCGSAAVRIRLSNNMKTVTIERNGR